MKLEDVINDIENTQKFKIYLHKYHFQKYVKTSIIEYYAVRENDVLLRDNLYEYYVRTSNASDFINELIKFRIPLLIYIRKKYDKETSIETKIRKFIAIQYNNDIDDPLFIDKPVPYTEYELKSIEVEKLMDIV